MDEAWIAIVLHYTFYICIVLFADPEAIRATGLHQPVAPAGCHSPLAMQEQVGLIGMPGTKFDLTRTKYWDPSRNLTTRVELRYGPYELIPPLVGRDASAGEVIISRNHTICASNFSEHVQEFWCPKERRCRNQHKGWEDSRTEAERNDPADACTLPDAGQEWYTLCGTPYVDPVTGRYIGAEYAWLVCGVGIVAMSIFTQVLAYPRTLCDVLRTCDPPKYYKVAPQSRRAALAEVIGREGVDLKKGGAALYRVAMADGDGRRRGEVVVSRDDLVSDGMGPVYAERGGLYGFYGVHLETSTRERLRYFDAHQAALDRLSRPLMGAAGQTEVSLMGVGVGDKGLRMNRGGAAAAAAAAAAVVTAGGSRGGKRAKKKPAPKKEKKQKMKTTTTRAVSKPRRSSRRRAN